MAFLVQWHDTWGGGAFVTYAAFQAKDDPLSTCGLYWREESRGGRRTGLPLVEVHFPLDCGTAVVTPEEAEQATGLHAPACWDKILDLL